MNIVNVIDEDKKQLITQKGNAKQIFLPGDHITDNVNFMRGHGTYHTDGKLVCTVAGQLEQINRLISVKPLRTRYNGEIGDIVVGRVLEVAVAQKRWTVDTNSRLHSVLMLSSINLPGGELRRKTAEDELMMKSYFREGDLISAEVQSVFRDGSLSLHTRSLKYGKLGQGLLVRVSPSLIERKKTHSHELDCGAHVILSNNGYVWISEPTESGVQSGGFALKMDEVALNTRRVMCRLRNCILILAKFNMMIYDTSIVECYQLSKPYEVKDLIQLDVMKELAQLAKQRLKQLDK